MTQLRLGAVEYLNARPLVFGLDSSRFALRFDVPSDCARLLQAGAIDLGLIPSVEYLRGAGYQIVPDLAIASRGPVASVALYITRPIADVRSIVMDTSSRTSVALVRVLCERLFKIRPALHAQAPNIDAMLARGDAALVIGDNALLWNGARVARPSSSTSGSAGAEAGDWVTVEKIDLGQAWTSMTGLPFVWAFWAGRPGAVGADDVRALREARDLNVARTEEIAADYFRAAPQHRDLGSQYLRDNIKYDLGRDERAGLEMFYRYAAEIGLVPPDAELRFYGQP